jgi:ssDNA-binding Zn-finger/Zn-ribbon topoisomerase 1
MFEDAKLKKRKCPACGGERVRRSQMRGFLERRILRTVGLRAYRCESCDKRHYVFEWKAERISTRKIANT